MIHSNQNMKTFFLKSKKAVSGESGPYTDFFFFFNFLIAGKIIFFSSELLLSSLLCGFKPRRPILGLILNILNRTYL